MTGSSPSSIMRSMVRTLTPPSCAAVSLILHSRVSGIEQVSQGFSCAAGVVGVLLVLVAVVRQVTALAQGSEVGWCHPWLWWAQFRSGALPVMS